MVKCGETSLEGEGYVKTLWDYLCRMVLWKLLNTCGWIFGACLLLWLKSQRVKGVSRHPAFMDNCRTISHTLYSPIYPVDEVNEDVGSIWDNILLFFGFFWCESSSLYWLKIQGGRGVSHVYQLKSWSSGRDWNVIRVTLHELDITFVLLQDYCMYQICLA